VLGCHEQHGGVDPVIKGEVVAGLVGKNAWYTGPMTVHCTCSDTLSGVKVCPKDEVINTNGAAQKASGEAIDAAGNKATTTVPSGHQPRPQEQRPHLAQIIVDDRLAAHEAQRLDQLAHPHARQRGSSLSSRWISSLNGPSFDGRSGQRNPGSASERNAARIVLRARPVRRANSLIDTPRTKCSRRSSDQRSTSSNASS
jgi:hypothetical protein